MSDDDTKNSNLNTVSISVNVANTTDDTLPTHVSQVLDIYYTNLSNSDDPVRLALEYLNNNTPPDNSEDCISDHHKDSYLDIEGFDTTNFDPSLRSTLDIANTSQTECSFIQGENKSLGTPFQFQIPASVFYGSQESAQAITNMAKGWMDLVRQTPTQPRLPRSLEVITFDNAISSVPHPNNVVHTTDDCSTSPMMGVDKGSCESSVLLYAQARKSGKTALMEKVMRNTVYGSMKLPPSAPNVFTRGDHLRMFYQDLDDTDRMGYFEINGRPSDQPSWYIIEFRQTEYGIIGPYKTEEEALQAGTDRQREQGDDSNWTVLTRELGEDVKVRHVNLYPIRNGIMKYSNLQHETVESSRLYQVLVHDKSDVLIAGPFVNKDHLLSFVKNDIEYKGVNTWWGVYLSGNLSYSYVNQQNL